MTGVCVSGGVLLLYADGLRAPHVQGAGDRQQTGGGPRGEAEQGKPTAGIASVVQPRGGGVIPQSDLSYSGS